MVANAIKMPQRDYYKLKYKGFNRKLNHIVRKIAIKYRYILIKSMAKDTIFVGNCNDNISNI